MPRQVTVLLADPYPLFRDALARVVHQERDFALVAEVADGRAALHGIATLRPDVAVLGAPLAGLPGERVAAAVARDRLPTKVVLLLSEPEPQAAFTALAQGAAACLTRAVEASALGRAIAAVARDQSVLAPELQTGVASEIRRLHAGGRPRLTVRERQVLSGIADGWSSARIASELRIAETTVKTHLNNATCKLGVPSRAAAVATSLRLGLLD
jgi:two-component system, NarL family, nitrate/nitrite response regulator NarL